MGEQEVIDLKTCWEDVNKLNEKFCDPLGDEIEKITGVNHEYSLFFGDEARCYAQLMLKNKDPCLPEGSLSMRFDFNGGIDLEEAIEQVRTQAPYWWQRYRSSSDKMKRKYMGLGVAIETKKFKPENNSEEKLMIASMYVVGVFRDWF